MFQKRGWDREYREMCRDRKPLERLERGAKRWWRRGDSCVNGSMGKKKVQLSASGVSRDSNLKISYMINFY